MEGLDDLLGRPLRRRIGSHVEVDHPAPMMRQYDQNEEHLEADGGHGKKVDGHRSVRWAQERSPGRRGKLGGQGQVLF